MEDKAKLDALNAKHENNDELSSLSVAGSWIDVDRTKFSYGGQLYPENLRFQVKPVQTKTIKYFSMLDENNPLSVNDALTYIVQHHIRVLDGKRSIDPLSIIYEHDRFYFVMLVHMYSGAPTSLSFPTACTTQTCKHKQDANVTPYVLQYKPLSDKALGWLNPKTGLFVIETKIGQYIYRPLTLAESIKLTEFAMQQRRDNNEIESLFTRVAPLIMSSNENLKAEDIYQKYLDLTNDSKKIGAVMRITEIIEPRQLLELEVTCQKCNNPFRSSISSVAGLRNIFVVHDIDDIFNA